MSKPMPIIPGTSYMFTRRCPDRRFWLRPDKATNQIIEYCTVYTAKRRGMVLHGLYAASNHVHPVVSDPHGQSVEFRRDCNSLISRAMNRLRKRRGALWDGSERHGVELCDEGAQIEAYAYVLSNPVKDGLVMYGHQWPGLRTIPEDIGKVRRVYKPKVFFKSKHLPEVIEYQLEMVPALAHLPRAEGIAILRDAVNRHEDQARKERAKDGLGFLGRRAVKDTQPHDAPTSKERKREFNPRIKCKDPELRRQAIERLKAFWQAHAEARKRWLEGDKNVKFPPGTYAFCTRKAPVRFDIQPPS